MCCKYQCTTQQWYEKYLNDRYKLFRYKKIWLKHIHTKCIPFVGVQDDIKLHFSRTKEAKSQSTALSMALRHN